MRANLVLFTNRAAPICIAVAAALLAADTSKAQSNLPVCSLIATGGTIAMKIDPIIWTEPDTYPPANRTAVSKDLSWRQSGRPARGAAR